MTKKLKQSDYEKALALLPWFAKGELSSEESEWVTGQLKNNATLGDELQLIEKQIKLTNSFVEGLDTTAYENQPNRLNALHNRIKQQKIKNEDVVMGENKSNRNNNSNKKNIWQKLLTFLPHTQGQWQVASAFAMVIMVAQGVIISQLAKTGVEYSTLSGESTSIPTDKIVLLTTFKKDVLVGQLESFLQRNNLKIISGPDLDKQYRLVLGKSKVSSRLLTEEEVSDLIFDLLDNRIIDFILREN